MAIADVASAGIGVVVCTGISEISFRKSLAKLVEKLRNAIKNVETKKFEQIQNLSEYFDHFESKIHNYSTHRQTSTINIIWCDKKIRDDENQRSFEKLKNSLSKEQYQIVQCDTNEQSIKFTKSNIQNNLILIASGSAGHEIVSKVGYYFHIKGIIIFCSAIEYHRTWAKQYKKVLLVTNQFSQVIQKINDIERGEIYFLNFGFSYEDITLKLSNFDYYLSTEQDGFIIQQFSDINLSIDHHKEIMNELHNLLVSKKVYPNDIPYHFQLQNLMQCTEKFVEVLKDNQPEKNIIRLYTTSIPSYYKIINDILNLLDEQLIVLIQDYIKALRYSLLIYSDKSNKMLCSKDVKLYRGIDLARENSFQEFLRKFNVNDTIVFPAFLSTTLTREVAMNFAGEKGVLLSISVDCRKSNKPRSISDVSQFANEDEVLLNCFSLLTVKKINKITDDLMLYECTLELR
ncbi:unnamed protein product [Rotaria sp. Silwood2]|nr:unnamed protein product [Rotaria sp. Silwood2]CAF4499110.1 unnamed protein product [Rotaria sp. Silwood2]